MKREWLQIEHILRFLGQETTKDIEMEYTLNNLKSAVIALMGFKLGWDDNEVFYENMKNQANKCIDKLKDNWLETESFKLEKLKDFINNKIYSSEGIKNGFLEEDIKTLELNKSEILWLGDLMCGESDGSEASNSLDEKVSKLYDEVLRNEKMKDLMEE